MAQGLLVRGKGVALWRQAAIRLRERIRAGEFDPDGRLPGEFELAKSMGVNRHTVRRALAELAADNLIETRHGEGTFVRLPRLDYRLGPRTRFHEVVAGQARHAHGDLIGHALEPASTQVAHHLGLEVGCPVLRLETLYRADGVAVSLSTAWFEAASFPSLVDDFRETGSLSQALARAGHGDYVRGPTRIHARLAEAAEAEQLAIAHDPVVIVNEYINRSTGGVPIQYAVTCFAAERVTLRVEGS